MATIDHRTVQPAHEFFALLELIQVLVNRHEGVLHSLASHMLIRDIAHGHLVCAAVPGAKEQIQCVLVSLPGFTQEYFGLLLQRIGFSNVLYPKDAGRLEKV